MLDKEAIKKAQRLDGKWVLITNDDTVSVEDTASAYKSLMVIEQCFRSLKKTQIEMGPMFHRLTERIIAHVKICVLALLIQRVAEIETGRTWKQLHTILDGLQVSEFQTSPDPEDLSSKHREVRVQGNEHACTDKILGKINGQFVPKIGICCDHSVNFSLGKLDLP